MKNITLSNSPKSVIVDDLDFEAVSKIKWSLNGQGSAICGKVKKKSTNIGRYILELKGETFSLGDQPDHIDHDIFNNWRNNLRKITKKQNMFNRRRQKNNKTGYIGVTYNKKCRLNPWGARLNEKRDGKTHMIYQKWWPTAKAAALDYDRVVIQHRGVEEALYSTLNFPETYWGFCALPKT